MSEISYEAACQMFNTEVTQQYQNLSKLKDTIEERHGLRGTHLNVPVSDLLEMSNSGFAATDIRVTPLNETNVQAPTYNYHLRGCLQS